MHRFDRGTYAKTYELAGSSDGLMKYSVSWSADPIFGRIYKTDYSTYILMNYCVQEYLDLYTREYWDIFTPDGTISGSLLTTLKAEIATADPTFDTSKLEASK